MNYSTSYLHKYSISSPAIVVGGCLFSVVVIAAAFGLIYTPYDPIEANFLMRFQAPSTTHWFGTDEYGRDILSRTLTGALISLKIGFATLVCSIFFGTVIGGVSGYRGGLVDRVVMMVMDAVMAFPGLLLVLGIMSVVGPDELSVILALSTAFTPIVARVVRGTVLSLRQKEFVEASLLMGNTGVITLSRHILPNCFSQLSALGTSIFSFAVLAETGLSFLGLGVPPPAPSWGSMLADGRQYIGIASWLCISPGIAITITLLSVNLIGDALRDFWDPRM